MQLLYEPHYQKEIMLNYYHDGKYAENLSKEMHRRILAYLNSVNTPCTFAEIEKEMHMVYGYTELIVRQQIYSMGGHGKININVSFRVSPRDKYSCYVDNYVI